MTTEEHDRILATLGEICVTLLPQDPSSAEGVSVKLSGSTTAGGVECRKELVARAVDVRLEEEADALLLQLPHVDTITFVVHPLQRSTIPRTAEELSRPQPAVHVVGRINETKIEVDLVELELAGKVKLAEAQRMLDLAGRISDWMFLRWTDQAVRQSYARSIGAGAMTEAGS